MSDRNLAIRKRTEVFRELGSHSIGALATCAHDYPFVRTVSCIFVGDEVFFQTDSTMVKAVQIQKNSNVALCFKHIQIRGVCENIGHPKLSENSVIFSLFQQFFPDAAKHYSALEKECFFRVIPQKIEVWRYVDGIPHIEFIDLDRDQYNLQKYEPDNS